jgi:hypothetical protein
MVALELNGEFCHICYSAKAFPAAKTGAKMNECGAEKYSIELLGWSRPPKIQ